MGFVRKFAVSLGMLALSINAAPAYAQSATVAPTRDEIQRQNPQRLPPATGRNVTVDGEIERAPCPLADDQFKDISVVITEIEFNGLEGLNASQMRPAYADLIGKPAAISAVCEIRDAAATILRNNGYLAAVQVPPQRIENGVVRFDVLMAKLVGFQVRGQAGKAEGLIEGYLQAISDQSVFNVIEAERYLLLARDIPGYDIRLALRPAGTVPGEVIGDVQVVFVPVEIDASVQNFSAREVGRFGMSTQLSLNGLLGIGDRTTISVLSTADFKEQQVVRIGQEIRLGSEGIVLAGDFTHAWTTPDLGPMTDLSSRTLIASLEARYPLLRRQAKNVFVSSGIDFIDQRTRFVGVPLTLDKLRVVYARLDFDALHSDSIANRGEYSPTEPKWRIGGTLELRKGLGILGASESCGPGAIKCIAPGFVPISRIDGKPDAFVARFSGRAEYRPHPIVALSFAPRLQYATDALLSYEEFSAGNFSVGRGYDPGTLSGDKGAGFSAELAIGSLNTSSSSDVAVQGFVFFDSAWVWNDDLAALGMNPQNLISAGGGLRFAYGTRGTMDVMAAVPLKKAGLQAQRGDIRLLVNLTMKLLP